MHARGEMNFEEQPAIFAGEERSAIKNSARKRQNKERRERARALSLYYRIVFWGARAKSDSVRLSCKKRWHLFAVSFSLSVVWRAERKIMAWWTICIIRQLSSPGKARGVFAHTRRWVGVNRFYFGSAQLGNINYGNLMVFAFVLDAIYNEQPKRQTNI